MSNNSEPQFQVSNIERDLEVTLSGFWQTTWNHRRDIFLSWDLPFSVVVSVAVFIFLHKSALTANFFAFDIAGAGASAALLGVIIAGMAIVGAFFSDEYLKVLRKTKSGVHGELWPFWLVTFLCICAFLTSMFSLLFDGQFNQTVDRWAVSVIVFFITYAFTATMNLVSLIVFQATNRSNMIARRENEQS